MSFNPLPSKKQVVEAGKVLAGVIPDHQIEDAISVFRIAHRWRNAHLSPLKAVRAELTGKLRHLARHAPTAARLKRMKSIRGKLAKIPITLYQMQDVGGCRVILPEINQVIKLASEYVAGNSIHQLLDHKDYVALPKTDGYRCHHVVLKFVGKGEYAVYNSRRVEMQIRTQLQHAWATAVEAVGLFRGEDLKGGFGDSGWLRFFELMSCAFALHEGMLPVPGCTDSDRALRSQLNELNRSLQAMELLATFNQVVQYSVENSSISAEYYLIQYDSRDRKVSVQPFSKFAIASSQYTAEEKWLPAISNG